MVRLVALLEIRVTSVGALGTDVARATGCEANTTMPTESVAVDVNTARRLKRSVLEIVTRKPAFPGVP
jgi:hypothetical protein